MGRPFAVFSSSVAKSLQRRARHRMTAVIGKDFVCPDIKNFGPAQDIRHKEALRGDDCRLRKKCQPFR
jgi:hypothetical protein